MTRTTKMIFLAMLLALCAAPIIDKISVSTVGDQAAYETCWSRNGVFFPTRWFCEMGIRSNIMMYALACGFNKDSGNDFCVTLAKVKNENESRLAAQKAHADQRTTQ